MTGALMTSSAPAQAADNDKLYKGGGIALGVLGAYMILKGKTVPGAVAAGAGYYAYKKGQKEEKRNSDRYSDYRYDDRYNDRYNDRYDSRYDDRYDDYRYDDDYRYNDYGYNSAAPQSNGKVVLK